MPENDFTRALYEAARRAAWHWPGKGIRAYSDAAVASQDPKVMEARSKKAEGWLPYIPILTPAAQAAVEESKHHLSVKKGQEVNKAHEDWDSRWIAMHDQGRAAQNDEDFSDLRGRMANADVQDVRQPPAPPPLHPDEVALIRKAMQTLKAPAQTDAEKDREETERFMRGN